MQNNANRPKVRVHHKRKFREITSLPTISIDNLKKSLLILMRILQNDHLKENALIIFPTNSLRKCMEISLKNL